MNWKKILLSCLILIMLFGLFAGCSPKQSVVDEKPEGVEKSKEIPETIKIGTAISLTGPYSIGAGITQRPNYLLWVEQVNKRGGIYIEEYGTKIPIEYIEYDDKSDIETAIRLIEKLITEDKVDFLLPPWGTAMHFAVAPVANEYGYPLLGPTLSSSKLRQLAPSLPYFFAVLNQPEDQMPALVDLLIEFRDKGKIGNRVAVTYVADLHGIEMSALFIPLIGMNDFELVYYKSYPLGIKDLSPILKEIKDLKPDVFIAFSYPADTMLITEQSKVLDFNPSVFYTSVGTAFPSYRNRFGKETIEGIMGAGAWNPEFPYPGAREYFEQHVSLTGQEPDRWGSAFAYASLQILEQAIERAGTIDRKKVRDIIATESFETIIGKVRFENQFNVTSPSDVGQWINGEFHGVSPKDKRTSEPLVPKPPWPR